MGNDQRKFFRIESMIGKEIEKVKLPDELGAGPVYEPEKKPASTGFKKPFKKKSNFRPKPRSSGHGG